MLSEINANEMLMKQRVQTNNCLAKLRLFRDTLLHKTAL